MNTKPVLGKKRRNGIVKSIFLCTSNSGLINVTNYPNDGMLTLKDTGPLRMHAYTLVPRNYYCNINQYDSALQVISSFFGTIGFFMVEWKVRRTARQGYVPITS